MTKGEAVDITARACLLRGRSGFEVPLRSFSSLSIFPRSSKRVPGTRLEVVCDEGRTGPPHFWICYTFITIITIITIIIIIIIINILRSSMVSSNNVFSNTLTSSIGQVS